MERIPNAEDELFSATKDRIMAEESLILDGLAQAVHRGDITEDEKHEWLNAYITARNTNRRVDELRDTESVRDL